MNVQPSQNPYLSPPSTVEPRRHRRFVFALLWAILLLAIVIALVWAWWLLAAAAQPNVDVISGAT